MVKLSLRKKIFISYLILFVIFVTLMYPFAITTVKKIMIRSMDDRTSELIEVIRFAPDNEELIKYLKDQKPLIFFRVSIITDERKVLYDSHTRRLLGPEFTQEYIVQHPEVFEAFEKGKGYHEEYSEILGQDFSYFAKTFPFHGKTYVMRTAFPYKYVAQVTNNFEIGFLLFATSILLLFSVVTWIIIHRLTAPINDIIQAIKPYEEGVLKTIPEIKMESLGTHDEFSRLASTLNSLSAKIQNNIDTITHERNEKVSILESLVEGVIAVDRKNRITYSNPMATKFLVEDGESLVGRTLSSLNQPVYEELVEASHRENQPMSAALQIRRKGRRFYLDVVAVPTIGEKGAVMVLQDQTTYHQMMDMRKNFIANASHELKTPLTIIRGFAEVLYDNPELPLETRTEITNKIVHNTSRMTNLIKDLLILSDVENIPQTRIVDFDLLSLANKCQSTILDLYPNATVLVEEMTEGPFDLKADPELIELALTNLMENAGKYSNPPPHITISLVKKKSSIEISVADKGIGIPPADLENIFQRFYTVDKAHSRKMGGSGLGLSIVETIIEKHGGKISADSEVNVGTTFTITLPTQLERMV